jgi:hypothetical protein
MNEKSILLKEMKVFTEFDFAEFPDPSSIEKETKLEYIKELINLTQEDKRSVYPYILFNIGAVVFIFGDMLDSLVTLSMVWKLATIFGILMLIFSSVCFFWYWRKIHRCHISLVSCIPGLDIFKAKEAWVSLWVNNKVLFKLGLSAMIAGILLSSLMFLALI